MAKNLASDPTSEVLPTPTLQKWDIVRFRHGRNYIDGMVSEVIDADNVRVEYTTRNRAGFNGRGTGIFAVKSLKFIKRPFHTTTLAEKSE